MDLILVRNAREIANMELNARRVYTGSYPLEDPAAVLSSHYMKSDDCCVDQSFQGPKRR